MSTFEKYEKLIDLLVNEQTTEAEALMHEIVVEKSRAIYQQLIAEEFSEEEEEEEESTENESYEEEEESEAVESIYSEEEEEEDESDFPPQDKSDDFEDDVEDHEFMDKIGGEHEEDDEHEHATKGELHDVEDALEQLKAEFEALMAAEKDEPEHADDDFDFDDHEEDGEEEDGEEEDEDGEEEEDESVHRSFGETMREYIEKVSVHMDGGLAGARTGETQPAPSEGKSPISSGKGKPTTGASPKNIAQGGKGEGEFTGTTPNADKGSRGLVGATKGEFTKAGTHNVNGVKSGVKTLKQVAKPTGREESSTGTRSPLEGRNK